MTLESINSYEDPDVNISIFAKGDPPPNGTSSGGAAPEEGDPPPNGTSAPSEPSTGDPPPNGAA
ncbi:MAG TPA: hypothetical protein VLH87_01970 [Pyrinomonadaceae bacterium]|nr:hypothetical protein [Pyrinomonadaceae bacterium]